MSDVPTTTMEYRVGMATGFADLTLKEVEIPPLRSTEVLVKVHAVSLQYRDLLVATGKYRAASIPNVVPGSDLAGVIIAVGSEVKGWKEGLCVMSNFNTDHVFGDLTKEMTNSALGAAIDGVLTQYKILPAHALVRMPDNLSFDEASTLPCAALTAYNALMGGGTPLMAGDMVLVEGTGGVSIFGLQIATASGATVIATSSSDAKLEIARKLGATHITNYKTHPEWHEEVLRLTKGRGVDHVIEVRGTGTLVRALKSVRIGGNIALYGHVGGQSSGRDDSTDSFVSSLIGTSVTLRRIVVGSRTQFEDLVRLIEANQLKPYIDKVFEFSQLKEAMQYLESQKHVGKVVVKVTGD